MADEIRPAHVPKGYQGPETVEELIESMAVERPDDHDGQTHGSGVIGALRVDPAQLKSIPASEVRAQPLAFRDRGDGVPYCLSCGALVESREGAHIHSVWHGYAGFYRINPPIEPTPEEARRVAEFER